MRTHIHTYVRGLWTEDRKSTDRPRPARVQRGSFFPLSASFSFSHFFSSFCRNLSFSDSLHLYLSDYPKTETNDIDIITITADHWTMLLTRFALIYRLFIEYSSVTSIILLYLSFLIVGTLSFSLLPYFIYDVSRLIVSSIHLCVPPMPSILYFIIV